MKTLRLTNLLLFLATSPCLFASNVLVDDVITENSGSPNPFALVEGDLLIDGDLVVSGRVTTVVHDEITLTGDGILFTPLGEASKTDSLWVSVGIFTEGQKFAMELLVVPDWGSVKVYYFGNAGNSFTIDALDEIHLLVRSTSANRYNLAISFNRVYADETVIAEHTVIGRDFVAFDEIARDVERFEYANYEDEEFFKYVTSTDAGIQFPDDTVQSTAVSSEDLESLQSLGSAISVTPDGSVSVQGGLQICDGNLTLTNGQGFQVAANSGVGWASGSDYLIRLFVDEDYDYGSVNFFVPGPTGYKFMVANSNPERLDLLAPLYSHQDIVVDSGSHFIGDGSQLTNLAGGQISQSSGNIGIGTATPEAQLDVNGDARIRGELTVEGDFNPTGHAVFRATDLLLAAREGIDYPTGGDRGDGGRALVQDWGDTLTINYDGDFTGGVSIKSKTTIDGNLTVNGQLNQVTVPARGGISMGGFN